MSTPLIKPSETVSKKLQASGLKLTPQRLVVYEALRQLSVHPTAEQVYEYVKPSSPTISLGTVYKTLDTFVVQGLISRVLTSDGCMRYDVHVEPHSHVYCTNTNEIIDYKDLELQNLLEEYFRRKNIYNLKINSIGLQINAEKIHPDENILIE